MAIRSNLSLLVRCFGELKDAKSAKRCVRHLAPAQRDEVLTSHALVDLGLPADAVKCAKREIKRELAELDEGDPNIHFPVMSICREREIVAKHESKDSAARILKRCLKQMSKWTVREHGLFTAAVYRMFAEAASDMGMRELARELLSSAEGEASQEKRAPGHKAAKAANLDALAKISGVDQALEEAMKLRSKPQKRKEVAKLLARAKRFRDLREFLQDVESPQEAANICWWVKFELPGGGVH